MGKKIYAHRTIMEKHLGRTLETKEIIHHIDGDHSNNQLGNLQIVSSVEHGRIHANPDQFKGVWKGRKHSLETKARMSGSAKARHARLTIRQTFF